MPPREKLEILHWFFGRKHLFQEPETFGMTRNPATVHTSSPRCRIKFSWGGGGLDVFSAHQIGFLLSSPPTHAAPFNLQHQLLVTLMKTLHPEKPFSANAFSLSKPGQAGVKETLNPGGP